MKVAFYIRVSTEEQATEGYSISAQKERLKAYCLSQDWTVVGVFIDEGISAKDMQRPQLQQMLKEIESGNIDVVLVYRLDRLTRSVLDLYKLLNIFEENDCKFASATEVYDTTTALGRLFITLVAALAQWERENMGERIRMGFQEKVRQGKYAHNVRPYGYNLDRETSTLTIKEDEARIVKLIVDLYLNKGYGANRICKYLNERKIKTGNGNVWNDKPLMQLLKNPLYMGVIRWGQNTDNTLLVGDSVPPIIDKETFEQVQNMIERRRSLNPKQISSDYIFSGVFRCDKCGHSMVGFKVYYKNAAGEKTLYKNYRCYRRKTGECKDSKSVSESNLEKAFLDYLGRMDFSTEIEEVSKKGLDTITEDNGIDSESLLKDLEKIKKRKKKWQYAWSEDMISDEDFKERMDEEQKLEEEVQFQLNEVAKQTDVVQVDHTQLQDVIKNIKENWGILEDTEKKHFIQLFIKQIHVQAESRNNVAVVDVDFN